MPDLSSYVPSPEKPPSSSSSFFLTDGERGRAGEGQTEREGGEGQRENPKQTVHPAQSTTRDLISQP